MGFCRHLNQALSCGESQQVQHLCRPNDSLQLMVYGSSEVQKHADLKSYFSSAARCRLCCWT